MFYKKEHNKLFFVKNINNKINDRFKRVYCLCGIKLTVKNKEKIKFYKQKKEELNNKKRLEIFNAKYKMVLEELNSNRKDKNPLLTIILLTYNHKSTIEKCIESLLNQRTRYEYIIKIYDDASTDGTSDICLEYAKKYPERIEYILQPLNTKGVHFRNAVMSIKTKYWCFIDGDDQWLGDDKIETALNFLEANPEYSIYANDFYHNVQNTKKSYSHKIEGIKYGDRDVSIENYIYLHPSARIHRNNVDWSEFKNMRMSDFYLFNISLAKGKCFFKDEIKSVWNYTGKGSWSSFNANMQKYSSVIQNFSVNYFLNWKYDKFFTRRSGIKNLKLLKLFLGKWGGWRLGVYLTKLSAIRKEARNIKKKYKDIEILYKLKDVR